MPRIVFATTCGWYDLHTPDNGINTIAAESARLEQVCPGIKLHEMKYNGINHGYEVTFISDTVEPIKALLKTDEGGGFVHPDVLTDGTIYEVIL